MKRLLPIVLIFLFPIFASAQPRSEAERIWEMGNRAYSESRFYDAIHYYEKALSLYPNKRSEEVGGLYDEIGLCYMQLGEHGNALKYFEKSLEITRRLNKPEHLSDVYGHMGQAYTRLESFEKAESYLKESLKIRKNLNNPFTLGESYNNLGLLYYRMGHWGKALDHYEESLTILRKNNYEREIGYLLSNIGMVYLDLQMYDKAKQYLEESLRIRQKFNNPQDIGIGYDNLGGVHYATGEYERAIYYFSKALAIRKRYGLSEDTALSLMNIGGAYLDLGKYRDALSYYKESLALFERLENPAYVVQTLENMAQACMALKKYSEAEYYFKRASEEEKKISKRFNLGIVEFHIATKNYRKALEVLRNAPDTPMESPSYKVQLYTLYGSALLNTGNPVDAAVMFFKAVKVCEDIRSKLTERQQFFKSGLYGGFIRPYRGLVTALSELSLSDSRLPREFEMYGNNPPSVAFYFSELTKGRTLLESMAGSARRTQSVDIPDYLKNREDELQAQLLYIDKSWEDALKSGEAAVKNLQTRREKVKAELDILISELRKSYPRYAALHHPLPVKADEIPLKENEVLFEYALSDNAVYLFVVKKGGVKRLIKIPVTREVLEEEIKTFIEPMNTQKPDKFSLKSARKLYEILLLDALRMVNDNEKIIIVPDGILGLLPFEALVITEEAGVKNHIYVADTLSVSYYQSATILTLQRVLKPSTPQKPLFALGNPIYSPEDPRYIAWKEKKEFPPDTLRQYAFRGLAVKEKWGKVTEQDKGNMIVFPPLPETEKEVRKIAEIMGVRPEPPEVLFSISASESNLKKASLEKYRYIHFATHASLPGLIQGLNEPFILLGQVDNRTEDGFLTLSEVASMKLNADMVVLSACVTGIGKEVEGEGVVNFARAFQQAGAKSVVVSLWEVASDPAVEYMETFYGHLKSGKSRAEALKLTRRAMKTKFTSPFYWAVFILHGEG